ncbi:MAG: peptidylprolyl isomerase [Clostridiales bacterium]|nr:peptidylprolyl isomerase [Clostridiales bacterium]
MKKKWAAAVLAMTMCVGLLTGCVSVNRDKDKAQIVAKVGDETLTKEQLYSQMQSYLSAYGMEDDLWDEGLDSQLREYMDEQGVTLAQSWMELRVAAAICDRDMPLTEEEIAEVEETYADAIDQVKTQLGYNSVSPESYEGNIDEDVDEFFRTYYATENAASYKEDLLRNQKYNKLYESTVKDVKAGDKALENRYKEDLAEQKETYEKTPSDFMTAITNESSGDYLLYKPENYLLVKQILIEYLPADKTKVETLSEEKTTLQEEVDTAQESLDTNQESKESEQSTYDAAKEAYDKAVSENDTATAETKKQEMDASQEKLDAYDESIAQAQKDLDTKKPQLEAKETELNNAIQTAQANVQAKVDEAMQKAKDGEDFDALIEQYNTDPGMQGDTVTAKIGYVIAPDDTTYDEDFVAAARTLTNKGDLTQTATTFGVHIIRLQMDAAAGELPYDQGGKEVVASKEDEVAKEEVWTEKMEQWAKELDAKVYESRVAFVK